MTNEKQCRSCLFSWIINRKFNRLNCDACEICGSDYKIDVFLPYKLCYLFILFCEIHFIIIPASIFIPNFMTKFQITIGASAYFIGILTFFLTLGFELLLKLLQSRLSPRNTSIILLLIINFFPAFVDILIIMGVIQSYFYLRKLFEKRFQ